MTKEEKAEVYATEQMKSYLCLDDYSYGVLKLKITEAYFDGLAEGRKEVREHETTCINRLHHIEKENEQLKAFESHWEEIEKDAKAIAKENAELKAEIQSLNAKLDFFLTETVAGKEYRPKEELDCLQKENTELKEKLKGFESGDVAWQGDMDATIKQNLELKAQNKDLCESLDIMNNRESELQEQIEKMKCCGNCSHRLDGTSFECKTTLWWQKCEKWELAE